MLYIRHLLARDLESVILLEKEAFGDQAWSEYQIRYCLRDRDQIGFVVELYDEVVGYYLYQYTAYRYDITRIAVFNKWRRRGIGSLMIKRLFPKLGNSTPEYPLKRFIINTVVQDDNLIAQLFFQHFGFTADSVLESGNYLMRYRFNPRNDFCNTKLITNQFVE